MQVSELIDSGLLGNYHIYQYSHTSNLVESSKKSCPWNIIAKKKLHSRLYYVGLILLFERVPILIVLS